MRRVGEKIHRLDSAYFIKRDEALQVAGEGLGVAGNVGQPRRIHIKQMSQRLRVQPRTRWIHDHGGKLDREFGARQLFEEFESIFADKFGVLDSVRLNTSDFAFV